MAMEYSEADVQMTDVFRKAADDAARDAYNQGMLRNEGEKLALERAKQAWLETYQKAELTGMYEGQFTMPTQQWQAETFGTWGAPGQGQQTQSAQQQAWEQAWRNAQTYGQYYGVGQAPATGTSTQAAQEQQYTQWLRAAQEARANQAQQQQTAQNYLKLLSELRGPADWAKYQQVLGATPGGMRDLTAAAMGQYIPGGGATTGQQPQAVNLQTMQQQIQGQGGGTNMMGADQAQAGQPAMGQLPAPNQIAPQSWKNLAPSQQQMIMGEYEAQGWHKPDVEALFAQSLPKYATNAPTAGTFRLRG
jgi:hypothetical protein